MPYYRSFVSLRFDIVAIAYLYQKGPSNSNLYVLYLFILPKRYGRFRIRLSSIAPTAKLKVYMKVKVALHHYSHFIVRNNSFSFVIHEVLI